MNKFFYIFYVYSCFISFPIFTMSGMMTKQSSKKADKAPLLGDLDDDPGTPPPSYFASSALQFPATQQSYQQTIADFQQAPPAPAPQQEVPMAAYSTAAPAFAQTSLQTTEPIFEPPQGTAQATSGVPKLLFLRGLMNQPPATQRSSFTRTNSFNPFADTDANPFVPTPPTINVVGSATSSSSSSSATSSAPSAPPMSQFFAVTTEKPTADHSQFVQPVEVVKPSEIQTDVKKEQVRQELLVLMRIYYIRPDDSESCSNVRNALIKKMKEVKGKFPDIKNTNEWFLNLPIDNQGNTLAHWAAINGDHRLLEILRKLGVDMFKLNFDGETPEDRVHKSFIAHAPLTHEERRRFLNEPTPEEEKKRVRKKKVSSDSSTTSSTSTTSSSVQPPVDEVKKINQYNAEQRKYSEERERKWLKRFEETKKFFIALQAKQEKK